MKIISPACYLFLGTVQISAHLFAVNISVLANLSQRILADYSFSWPSMSASFQAVYEYIAAYVFV